MNLITRHDAMPTQRLRRSERNVALRTLRLIGLSAACYGTLWVHSHERSQMTVIDVTPRCWCLGCVWGSGLACWARTDHSWDGWSRSTAVRVKAEGLEPPVAALARLALVLAAGGLPLDTPGALLVRAVADGAFVNLHLSAGRDHRRVRVAVRPCAQMGEAVSNWEKACWKQPTELQRLALSGSNCQGSKWNYVSWPHVSFMS